MAVDFEGEGRYHFRAVGVNDQGETEATTNWAQVMQTKEEFIANRKGFVETLLGKGWKEVKVTHAIYEPIRSYDRHYDDDEDDTFYGD